MTNLDQLKAKIADMDSERFSVFYNNLQTTCDNCGLDKDYCASNCKLGFRLWLEQEATECN